MRIDNHNHIGVEMLAHLQGSFPYAQALEDLRAKAAKTDVTHWIVFPFVSYLYPAKIENLNPPLKLNSHINPTNDTPEAPYAHANRLLLEETEIYFPENPRQFLPFVMLDPERAVQAQVHALRRLKERYRFFGFKIQSTIIQSRIRALLEDSTLLDLAAEWDMPFLIHSSISPADKWAQASDILDIVEARPDIRFLLAHSCRFDQASLDRVAALPNAWFDCSAHRIHCDLAVKDSSTVAQAKARFPADYNDPTDVLRRLAEAYPEKLIWGSDSPYYSWISNATDSAAGLRSSYPDEWACVAALPEATQERITKTNTLNWLNCNENDLLT